MAGPLPFAGLLERGKEEVLCGIVSDLQAGDMRAGAISPPAPLKWLGVRITGACQMANSTLP